MLFLMQPQKDLCLFCLSIYNVILSNQRFCFLSHPLHNIHSVMVCFLYLLSEKDNNRVIAVLEF